MSCPPNEDDRDQNNQKGDHHPVLQGDVVKGNRPHQPRAHPKLTAEAIRRGSWCGSLTVALRSEKFAARRRSFEIKAMRDDARFP